MAEGKGMKRYGHGKKIMEKKGTESEGGAPKPSADSMTKGNMDEGKGGAAPQENEIAGTTGTMGERHGSERDEMAKRHTKEVHQLHARHSDEHAKMIERHMTEMSGSAKEA